MTDCVLWVDDDAILLNAYKRQLKMRFDIVTALGAHEALEILRNHEPFAVIVSDMGMPDIDGLQFLIMAREMAPQTTRIMLTGNSDLKTAVDAINDGHVFRFLKKACGLDHMIAAIAAGMDLYHLHRAEKELIERTLKGSIKVLTDILSLLAPLAFGRGSRVRRLACQIAAKMNVEATWQIELAAMLSQVGCVTVPEDILSRAFQGKRLTAEEQAIFDSHPKIGSDLLKNIPRLEIIAELILCQDKHFDGTGQPRDGRSGIQIPMGARILKVAFDYDSLLAMNENSTDAFAQLSGRSGWYDPNILEVLAQILLEKITAEIKSIEADEIAPGMVLAHDLKTTGGLLLLAKGHEITAALCLCLKNLALRGENSGTRHDIQRTTYRNRHDELLKSVHGHPTISYCAVCSSLNVA